jgi:hypothetical protein
MIKLKRLFAFALAAILSLSAAGASTLPLPSAEATTSITARELKMHLSFLASDELGGRYTFSPSLQVAARYLASQLESYGYRGGARDGSFFQKVPLVYSSVSKSQSGAELTSGGQSLQFKYGESFVSEPPTNISFSGDLVFIGYGISSPKNGHDDFAGLDLKGKIVVVVNGAPESLRSIRLSADERWETVTQSRGAAGIIVIPPSQQLMVWNQLRNYFDNQQELGLPPKKTASGQPLQAIIAGPEMVRAIAKAMSQPESLLTAPAGKPLKSQVIDARAKVNIAVEIKDAPLTQNVIGVLEGSDPKLKDEYVVISAHYDHLKTSDTGEVYNGADDDGSGTVAILEIAQAFATGQRSKRSILVIFHTAEELGLFGSEYIADYEPVVPIEKMVTNLNIDMIGRSRSEKDKDARDRFLTDKDSIYVIGSDKLSTELHGINEQTNAETARMRFDYTYNDDRHPERFYYRSDHYNYAKHGVPVIFYFTGVHRDYHRATDDVEKIDFEKMERIARMIFATGWRVANGDNRPVVDKKPASSTTVK